MVGDDTTSREALKLPIDRFGRQQQSAVLER